jgi:hypothetical protein
MTKRRLGLQFPPKHSNAFFSGQTHKIRGCFRCVDLQPIKRLDVAFLSNSHVIEELMLLPDSEGKLRPTIDSSYQAIVDNDTTILEWYHKANHGDTMEKTYDVELVWNICEFEEGKITYFVRERWKAFDLARYYVVMEYPNNPPVWL